MSTTTQPLGIHASILREARKGDSSLHGISSRCVEVTVIDEAILGHVEPSEGAPAVRLVRRWISGRLHIHAEPWAPQASNQIRVAGGCFIWSPDGRFASLTGYPIALHDRDETQRPWSDHE